MTTTLSTTRTYRRTYLGLWMGAGLLFALAIGAGYPLVGVAAFAGGALAATALQHRAPALFDERDTTIFQAAGANTIAVVGLTSAVFFPTMTLLWALDIVAWPPWLAHLGYFVTGLFAVWGLALAAARLRR